LLTVFALARGTFWAAALLTPSPIDESQHFDYVRSLARGEGIPTVGQDVLGGEVLHLAKQSPTFYFRSQPYPDDKDAPEWQGAPGAAQYEGIQGPVYYALLTPFYWAGRPWGVAGSFYLVRFGSALLGALAIPLSWLLARRLVPNRPSSWLLPPILLASLNAVSAGSAAIGNDVIVLTGTAAAAVLLLRGLERRSTAAALGAGLVAGLVFVGKTTALALVPLLALLALPVLVRWWREAPWRPMVWVAVYGTALVAALIPWLAWNLATYGAISGSSEAEAITGSLQVSYAPSIDTFRQHWSGMRRGFWAGQLNDLVPSYGHVWELVAVLAIAIGLVVAWRRRSGHGWAIAWGALSYPLSFAAVAGFFLMAFDRSGLILGRYTWVALVPLVTAIGLGLGAIGGRRFGLALCLSVTSLVLYREVEVTHTFLRVAYENDLAAPRLAPVIEQSWNDGYGAADAVKIDIPCPATVIDLGLQKPPHDITVETRNGDVAGTLVSTKVAEFTRYQLAMPVSGIVEIPVTTGVAISVPEREPAGSLVGGTGDPMLRVHCAAEDPRAIRFEQLYSTIHPPLTRSMLYAWPVAWVVVSGIAAFGALLSALVPRPRPRRRRSADGDDADALR